MTTIEGTVDPRFKDVRDAFAVGFDADDEVGAAVTVVIDGEVVVDLWGGIADPTTARAWDRDTAAVVFSTTKGVTATCALHLVAAGQLDPDEPVATYWPEFAAAGKEDVTVRLLMSHQAGLTAFDRPVTGDECHDHVATAALLAAQAPRWEPGTAHGYHALTFGWLVGELVRRVDGRSVGRYLADEIAGPHDLDLWLGLPEAVEHRVAPLQAFRLDRIDPSLGEAAIATAIFDPTTLTAQTLGNPSILSDMTFANSRAYRAAEWPAVSGVTTARGLAGLYALLATDALLPADVRDEARRPHATGLDRVLLEPTSYGLGYMLHSPFQRFGLSPTSFGHGGAGGSLGFADPESGIGFGYVMNQMNVGLGTDPRPQRIAEAVYAAL